MFNSNRKKIYMSRNVINSLSNENVKSRNKVRYVLSFTLCDFFFSFLHAVITYYKSAKHSQR